MTIQEIEQRMKRAKTLTEFHALAVMYVRALKEKAAA
jgi:hypothetical protein